MRRKSTANVMVVGSMLVGMLLLALAQAEPVRAQFGGGQGFNFGGFNGFGQFNGGFQGAFGQFNGGFQGGFNGQFQGGGFNGQFQGGNFQGGQFNGGFQGGFNGGQFGNFQSGFNGGGFQGINIGASGPNTTCGGFNFGQGSFQFGANGINLGQIGGCTAGVFGLIPDSTQVSPGQPITYQLVWITPTNWQDLEFLELRIRNAAGNIIGILRWVQGTDEYQLIDPATGQVLARGAAGGNGTLEGPYLTVVLSRSSSENTGATGQAVGLSITLILKELAANNLYGIDVRAKLDNAAVVPYELAALIFVTANDTVGKSDDDGDDDRKGRKPTKEELQQAQRTNRSNLDDVRTEGNALESDCGAPVPTVTIANRDGRVVIRLLHEAALACRTVQPGDYIEAVGEKQHEQLYDADELTVRRNGTRVR